MNAKEPTTTTDALVRQALGGDRQAFSHLVRAHKHAIYALCRKYVRDSDIADDLAQEAFVKAYHNLTLLRDPARFPDWLKTIAANGCLTYIRRSRKQIPEDYQPEHPSAEISDWVEHDALKETVIAALQRLPDSDRQILNQYYLDEVPSSAIAKASDIRPGTVKVRLHRARNRLREAVTKMLENTTPNDTPGPDFDASISAMIVAIETGNTRALSEQIERNPALAAARKPDGHPLLLWAIIGVHFKGFDKHVVDLLLDHSPNVDIHSAAFLGDTARIAHLLGTEPEALHTLDFVQRTPLLWAARQGHLDIARLLLDRGADVNHAAVEGWTALHLAINSDAPTEMIQLLVENGADLSSRPGGETPLHGALNFTCRRIFDALDDQDEAALREYRNVATNERIQIMLRAGCELDICSASGLGDIQTLKRLVAERPDCVGMTIVNGMGPIHWAAPFGREDVIDFLIEAGVPVDLHMAAFLGLENQLKSRLREDPGSVNHHLPGSTTALHMAAFYDRQVIVEVLLSAGCDADVKDYKGMTALDRARACGNAGVVKLLEARTG
jgi:RNA polymerase sigma factor (sigma-70 family)